MSRPGRAARLAGAAIVSLVLLTALPAAPTLGLSKTACRVRHVETGTTYRSLAAAVAAATSVDHLTVRGVCHGTTTIDADHALTGLRPRGAVKPVLDGDGGGSVLTIPTTRTVTVASLSIIDGSGSPCLTTLTCAGGVFNDSTLTIDGSAAIRDNIASMGGGIYYQASSFDPVVCATGAATDQPIHSNSPATALCSTRRVRGVPPPHHPPPAPPSAPRPSGSSGAA